MPAAAVAGAGVLTSAYSAHQAGKRQDKAMKLQKGAMDADQAFRQQMWDDYKENYGPLEQELLQKASSEGPLNLGPTWAKIQGNFDQAARNNEASMARKGMLGSGLDQNNTLESGRAFALSDAFGKGLQAKDLMKERLIAAGRQMPQQAGFVSQGNTNMANLYGNQASMFGNAAAGAGQSLASSLGSLGYALQGVNWGGGGGTPTVKTDVSPPPVDTLTPIISPTPINPIALNPGGLLSLSSLPSWPSGSGGVADK